MKSFSNISMAEYTTFKCGGNAASFIVADDEQELAKAIKESKGNYVLLGNGSNVLFKDNGFDGTVIKLGDSFTSIVLFEGIYSVGAGVLLPVVSKQIALDGYTGFEFACGIPGSLGGAIYMNAGAYGSSISDVIYEVTSMKEDGTVVRRKADELNMSYRHSVFMENNEIILGAKFKFNIGDRVAIENKMAELTKARQEKQPLAFPSAGSFFKRPEGFFAGKLIEDAGLKGYRIGGAEVSDLHAGFIINKNNATATDVLNLMKYVQNVVKEKFGIELEPEVRILGND